MADTIKYLRLAVATSNQRLKARTASYHREVDDLQAEAQRLRRDLDMRERDVVALTVRDVLRDSGSCGLAALMCA